MTFYTFFNKKLFTEQQKWQFCPTKCGFIVQYLNCSYEPFSSDLGAVFVLAVKEKTTEEEAGCCPLFFGIEGQVPGIGMSSLSKR